MDPQTAYERRADLQLLDIRERFEWDAGHIEEALHVPIAQLEARRSELATDRVIVTVCRSGPRATAVTETLVRAGFRAQTLDGGMKAWAAAALPFAATGRGAGRVA